jgi:hypothetical protein
MYQIKDMARNFRVLGGITPGAAGIVTFLTSKVPFYLAQSHAPVDLNIPRKRCDASYARGLDSDRSSAYEAVDLLIPRCEGSGGSLSRLANGDFAGNSAGVQGRPNAVMPSFGQPIAGHGEAGKYYESHR